jgi:hypothetical protein
MYWEQIQALSINLIAGSCIALLTSVFIKKRKLYIIVLSIIILSVFSTLYITMYIDLDIPRAQKVFSDFNRNIVSNNFGYHWGVFTDSPYNGNSKIQIYSKVKNSNPSDGYLIIEYILGDKLNTEPYCGVYSWFSPRPIAIRDVSHFSGVRLTAWHKESLPDSVRIYVSVGVNEFINYYDGDFRYEFSQQLRNDGMPSNIMASFEDMKLPLQFPGDKVDFTDKLQEELYQISFVIVGNPGVKTSGVIMIDDIEFY